MEQSYQDDFPSSRKDWVDLCGSLANGKITKFVFEFSVDEQRARHELVLRVASYSILQPDVGRLQLGSCGPGEQVIVAPNVRSFFASHFSRLLLWNSSLANKIEIRSPDPDINNRVQDICFFVNIILKACVGTGCLRRVCLVNIDNATSMPTLARLFVRDLHVDISGCRILSEDAQVELFNCYLARNATVPLKSFHHELLGPLSDVAFQALQNLLITCLSLSALHLGNCLDSISLPLIANFGPLCCLHHSLALLELDITGERLDVFLGGLFSQTEPWGLEIGTPTYTYSKKLLVLKFSTEREHDHAANISSFVQNDLLLEHLAIGACSSQGAFSLGRAIRDNKAGLGVVMFGDIEHFSSLSSFCEGLTGYNGATKQKHNTLALTISAPILELVASSSALSQLLETSQGIDEIYIEIEEDEDEDAYPAAPSTWCEFLRTIGHGLAVNTDIESCEIPIFALDEACESIVLDMVDRNTSFTECMCWISEGLSSDEGLSIVDRCVARNKFVARLKEFNIRRALDPSLSSEMLPDVLVRADRFGPAVLYHVICNKPDSVLHHGN